VLIPIAAAVPDVISLLEQINTSPGTCYVAIDLTNAVFSIPAFKAQQKQVAFSWQNQQYTSLSNLRDISTLQPHVTISFTGI
jgi:hypothetical protein